MIMRLFSAKEMVEKLLDLVGVKSASQLTEAQMKVSERDYSYGMQRTRVHVFSVMLPQLDRGRAHASHAVLFFFSVVAVLSSQHVAEQSAWGSKAGLSGMIVCTAAKGEAPGTDFILVD